MARSLCKQVAFILLMFLGAYAQAQMMGSVRGQFLVTHSKVNFAFNQNAKVYVLKKMNTVVEGDVVGKGLLVGLSNPVQTSTNKVVGKDIKGHISVRLDLSSDSPHLIWEIALSDEIGIIPINANRTFTTPVTITEGSLEGFSAGENIVFSLAKGSERELALGLKEGLKEVLDSGLSDPNMIPELQGMQIKTSIKEVKMAGPIQIIVSQKQISIPRIAVSYNVGLSANLKSQN